MTIDDDNTLVTMQIEAGPDADAEQIDLLTRQLRSEIEDAGFETNLVKGDAVPEGAKSVEAVMLGALVVTMLPTAITNLLDLLRDWSSRGNNQNVTIRTRIGDQEVTIEYPPTPEMHDRISQILNNVLAPREATSIKNQSGGIDLEADHVGVGGDMMAGDKFVVYVNQPPAAPDTSANAGLEEYQ